MRQTHGNWPMTEEMQTNTKTDLSGDRTDLAVERTVMAASRTLMGWIRTALSLISFGFTIYKILQGVAAELKIGLFKQQDPRRLGLVLIGLGTASVVIGAIDYYKTLKRLNKMSDRDYSPFNFTFSVGMLIGLLGLFLFITILTHTEIF
jgi:putative membrane protein